MDLSWVVDAVGGVDGVEARGTSMRAWRFSEFGDIGNFRLGEYPRPEVGPGEILIKVRYAALNPADRLLIEGKYPGAGRLPLTVGREGAGKVESSPAGGRFKSGDAVVVLRSEIGITRQGTLAEYVAVPEPCVAPLPSGWSMEEAAGCPLVYLTAWKALVTQGGLTAGKRVVVNGASGGVGIASVQLGKALGARVVALSRGEVKRQRLLTLGADAALDPARPDLEARVRDTFGGRGADIVVENLGGPFLAKSVSLADLGGRVMVIGLLAGRRAELEMGPVLFKQVRIEGVHVGKFSPEEARGAWDAVVSALDRTGARPLIDKIFPMGEVQEAFAHLAGDHMGKVLVDVTAP